MAQKTAAGTNNTIKERFYTEAIRDPYQQEC
jgi:hypothetical protein